MKGRDVGINRRSAITGALIGGITASLGTGTAVTTAHLNSLQEPQEDTQEPADYNEDKDRQAVKAAGFTDDEAECWKLIAEATGKFFELPELHPMDKQEVATAVHVIQNKLLSRPTYRTYVAEAKRLRGE